MSTAVGRRTSTDLGRWLEQALVVTVLIAVALVCALVFVVAIGALDAEVILADPATADVLLGPIIADGTSRVLFAGGSFALGLGALALLVRKTSRRSEPSSGALVLSSGDSGLVVITNGGVASLVKHAVARTRGVVEADVTIKGKGAAPIGIRVDTLARPGTDVEKTGNAVRDAARSAAERLGGLEVADVVVKLDVMSPEDLGLRAL